MHLQEEQTLTTLRNITAVVAFIAAVSQVGAASIPPPQVAISPPRVEIAFENGSASSAIRLFNLGQESLEVEVAVGDWYLDENNEIVRTAPSEDSLARWMLLSPRRFRVEGQESQALRFAFRPKTQPRDGEHRAMLYLRQVQPERRADETQFLFQFAVPVYVSSGEVVRTGQLNGIEVAYEDGVLNADFDISSDGNAKVRMNGNYRVRKLDSLGAELEGIEEQVEHSDVLPDMPVLAGTRRTIHLSRPMSLPSGRYAFEVDGDLAERGISTTVQFQVQ